MTDKIIIEQNKLEYLYPKKELIFKLFETSINSDQVLDSFDSNQKKLWINISGTRTNINKTKKFISSLCYPQKKERIKIDQKSANYLRSKNYINNLIREYQVYLEVSNNEILIQGSNTDVTLVKNIIDTESIRSKDPVVFSLDNQNDDIIFLKDAYEAFDETNSNAIKMRKNEKTKKEQSKLIQFEPKISILNDQDCEIINFVPSTSKMEKEKKPNNSASLNEYAKLFEMDYDKEAEKQNKVIRIDKLISVMDEEQKILALNHVSSYQRKNSKKPEVNENDLIKIKPHNQKSSKNIALNNFEDIMNNFYSGHSLNKQEIQFEPKKNRNRARSRTERESNQDNNSKNLNTGQNNLHGRSKSSAPSKKTDSSGLRHIIIDGSNVAREHGKLQKSFSSKGIKIAVDFFLNRGHQNIHAIVPRFRRGNSDKECPTLNPEILDELEEKGHLTYTPSRYVDNKLIVSYDDRFILEAAFHYQGVIVSNDNYRDLMKEKAEWKKLVETSLLLFSFIGDLFMVASDPMGRKGPTLDEFLSKPSDKSNAFKYIHSSSVLTDLKPKSFTITPDLINFKQLQTQGAKKKNNRSQERENLIAQLTDVFPNDENNIRSLVYDYKEVRDVNFFAEKLMKRK